jgi:hypothetical protein
MNKVVDGVKFGETSSIMCPSDARGGAMIKISRLLINSLLAPDRDVPPWNTYRTRFQQPVRLRR